jgi:hypothetical protein
MIVASLALWTADVVALVVILLSRRQASVRRWILATSSFVVIVALGSLLWLFATRSSFDLSVLPAAYRAQRDAGVCLERAHETLASASMSSLATGLWAMVTEDDRRSSALGFALSALLAVAAMALLVCASVTLTSSARA